MPKSVLFLLKNRKNRRALGLRPPSRNSPLPHDEFLATRLLQVVMKCFLLTFEKRIGADSSCCFREKRTFNSEK